MRVSALIGVAFAALLACERGDASPEAPLSNTVATDFAPLPLVPEGYEFATLAGGCFWCLEADLEKLPGVLLAVSGYTGGHKVRPTYEETGTKTTGHAEAVRVIYDPKRLSYAQLLEFFWRHIDPTDAAGQFCDRGNVYRPEIFVHDDEQRRVAEASRRELESSRPFAAPIRVPITNAGVFWTAENYHQDYSQKNPLRYRTYRVGCGRDRRLESLWGPTGNKARP